MTLKGVGGGSRNSGKRENQGILRMGGQILMKLDIQKNLMSQMLHFQLELDPGTYRGLEGKQKSSQPEILEDAQTGEIEMKLDGKNKHKLYT